MLRAVAFLVLAAGVGAVVAAGMLGQWAGIKGGPLAVAGLLFMDAGPIPKLIMLVVALATVSVLAIGAPALLTGKSTADGGFLRTLGYGAPLLGLLGAAYEAWAIYSTVQAVGPVRFIVMAPSVAGAILVAGIGFVAGGLALGVRAFLPAPRQPA